MSDQFTGEFIDMVRRRRDDAADRARGNNYDAGLRDAYSEIVSVMESSVRSELMTSPTGRCLADDKAYGFSFKDDNNQWVCAVVPVPRDCGGLLLRRDEANVSEEVNSKPIVFRCGCPNCAEARP